MKPKCRYWTMLVIAAIAAWGPTQLQAQQLLDAFDDISGWKAIPSDGVNLSLHQESRFVGRCLVLDFEFRAGAGYPIAQKEFNLDLPENFKLTFYLRGETPDNNFEFKLIDSLDNVYWIK